MFRDLEHINLEHMYFTHTHTHTQFYETGVIIGPIISVWVHSGELLILTEKF